MNGGLSTSEKGERGLFHGAKRSGVKGKGRAMLERGRKENNQKVGVGEGRKIRTNLTRWPQKTPGYQSNSPKGLPKKGQNNGKKLRETGKKGDRKKSSPVKGKPIEEKNLGKGWPIKIRREDRSHKTVKSGYASSDVKKKQDVYAKKGRREVPQNA